MANLILKDDIVRQIKRDPVLFGKVAEHLDAKPSYFLQMLKSNSVKLTQAGVLQLLREYLKIKKDSDLLTELQHSEKI